MRDGADAKFPAWLPKIVCERAQELHAQSIALAEEAGQRAAVAAEQQQQLTQQQEARAIEKELKAAARMVMAPTNGTIKLALQRRLLELAVQVRAQAAAGAKAVREAQEAAARNWQLDADNILRLACDHSLQGVWTYFGQRRRDNRQLYFHPARDEERDREGKPAQHWRDDRYASRAEWKQALAFEGLFSFMLATSRHARAAAGDEARSYRAEAKVYRDAAARELAGFGFAPAADDRVWSHPKQRGRVADALQRVADEMDAMADRLEDDAAKRTHLDIVRMVGDKLYELFKQRFHTQAAAIASVILGEAVSKRTAVSVARKVSPKSRKKPARVVYSTERKKN
jgi:hypothetical protein